MGIDILSRLCKVSRHSLTYSLIASYLTAPFVSSIACLGGKSNPAESRFQGLTLTKVAHLFLPPRQDMQQSQNERTESSF